MTGSGTVPISNGAWMPRCLPLSRGAPFGGSGVDLQQRPAFSGGGRLPPSPGAPRFTDFLSDGQGKVVLVAGAQAGEGAVAELAAALAHAGADVLLVDSDLPAPSLGEIFQTGERCGLMTCSLAGRGSMT